MAYYVVGINHFDYAGKDGKQHVGNSLYLLQDIPASSGSGKRFVLRKGNDYSLIVADDVLQRAGIRVGSTIDFNCDFNGRILYESIHTVK